MKKRAIIVLLLLLAALSCTAWAADGEPEELETCTIETQVLPRLEQAVLTVQEGAVQDQPLYQDILKMFQRRDANVDVMRYGLNRYTGGGDVLLYYVTKVLYDHPEFYYARTAVSYSDNFSGRISTLYAVYIDELLTEEVQAAMDRRMAEAMERVADRDLTDLDKALILHDYLVEQIAYNWDIAVAGSRKEEQEAAAEKAGLLVYTAYGALVEGDAVCQGYALAYKLLLGQCGIDSVLVSSDAMNHVWNAVELDGSWYHVDVTWDDPVPDLPGYCSHDNFLRSDMGIKAEGHDGWTVPDGITVSKREPEGLFRDTSNGMYYYEGSYYYLIITSGKGSLYRADSLTDPEPETVEAGMDFFRHRYLNPDDGLYYSRPQYGVVWHEGALYYVDDDRTLTCYNLTDGSSAELCGVPFDAGDSADGKYDSTRDTIGLYYDSQTGEIVAVSKTRPDLELARFQVKEYPVSWDQLDEDITALAGGVQKEADDTLQVGLVWAEQGQKADLLAAFYQDGRLVKVKAVTSDTWTQGLNVLTLDVKGYPDYDQVLLFLLSDDSVPYCEKKAA